MDRTTFYDKATVVDGDTGELIQQFDYLYNSLSNFVMNYDPQYYMVSEADLMRPDMISFKVYKTVDLWWLIAFVNDIQDPFNDIEVGKLLVIPNILDIYDFYKKFRILS